MNGTPLVPSVVRALAIGFVLLGASAAHAQTPSFTLVGHAGTGSSRIDGLSADGRTAAGSSHVSSSSYPGLIWSQGSGRYDFGFEAGLPGVTQSFGLSGDGRTVVGGAAPTYTGRFTAFRWSGPGTFQSLGTLPGHTASMASSTNNDGSIIVGRSASASESRAFRWTSAGGMQPLGPTDSEANAISRDGNVVVGETALTSGAPQAYQWTQAGGLRPLAGLNGSTSSSVNGVSADGRFIVGLTNRGAVSRPTLWREGQPVDLGLPTGWSSPNPNAVSDDGQVVVGDYSAIGFFSSAAIWTPATGFLPLADYLASNGVAIPAGVLLESCTSVSADGRTFAGWTVGSAGIFEGYVATVPTPPTGALVLMCAAPLARRRR